MEGMFLDTFKGASQVSKRSSKGVSREFQDSFKDVLRKFQGCSKKMSSFKGVSRMFQFRFVAWISSQLPKQKEGLFVSI